MANAIVGTIVLLAMATVFGVPFGIFGGIYLAEYGSDRANGWIRFAADVLNGVPSIVWGMVVYLMLVVPFKGFSAYAGGVALGLMMVPLVMRTTEEVLILVPQSYREAALALGVARWKMIVVIVVQDRAEGDSDRRHRRARPHLRGDRAPPLHGARKHLLEPQPEGAHLRPPAPDLRLRALAVRRLAPAGLGRGPCAHGFDRHP